MNRVFGMVIVAALVLFIVAAPVSAESGTSINQGMRGDNVRTVQGLLANAGFYTGDIDGIFGNETVHAVKRFQESVGLTPDGTVGSDTFTYLQRSGGDPSRFNRGITMEASAYSANDDGNSNYTYRGNRVHKGLVAVDPGVIPLGTRLYIAGYGYAVADDIGGAIRGNRIDLGFETHQEAMQFGVRTVQVYILD